MIIFNNTFLLSIFENLLFRSIIEFLLNVEFIRKKYKYFLYLFFYFVSLDLENIILQYFFFIQILEYHNNII